jgi:hypothetical protein
MTAEKTEPIKSFEDAEKAIESLKRKGAWASINPDWNIAIDRALEILRELEASELLREKFNQNPMERAKQAVNFINWHIDHLKKTAPYARISINSLVVARDEILAFVLYDDEGNRRDDKSG